ncbi:MAG: thiamine pyrophosphate-dependent enzyme [Candidatus Zixiibacteriota bacterium]
MEKLTTNAENTWCPGCGNFGILNAVQEAIMALDEDGTGRENIVMTTGIGCHGKMSDYLKQSGIYTLHGRGGAVAQGIKIGNPDLKVIAFGGDGDSYGEGLAHTLFAAKRNSDITVIIHNNGAYSLTTGQASPTSRRGFEGPSTPDGSYEDPINPIALLLEIGASFVARGYSAEKKMLKELIIAGIKHPGFALIDVLQPSVVFSERQYKEIGKLIEKIEDIPDSREKAIVLSKAEDKLPIGIFYKEEKKPYHKALYGDFNPAVGHKNRDWCLKTVDKLIEKN